MKFLDLLGLTELVDLCKKEFAQLIHKHSVNDLTDYKVDDAFSATSTNSIQNKIVNAALLLVSNDLDIINDKLNTIEEGATKTIVDNAFSSTSTNPVENRIVSSAIDALTEQLNNINTANFPVPTTNDNEKFLRVVNGMAVWYKVSNAEEAKF